MPGERPIGSRSDETTKQSKLTDIYADTRIQTDTDRSTGQEPRIRNTNGTVTEVTYQQYPDRRGQSDRSCGLNKIGKEKRNMEAEIQRRSFARRGGGRVGFASWVEQGGGSQLSGVEARRRRDGGG